MIEVDWRDVPALMRAGARGVKIAGVQTLNTVAFRSLPELIKDAQDGMKFRTNARGSLGWQVDRATTSRPEVVIQTRRKWLKPHLEEGTREARSGGWVFQGREYLIIPIKKAAFGKGGVMKPGYLSGVYVVQKGNQGLVFYRAKRGAKQSELVAVLVENAKTKEDTKPQEVINRRFNADATRLLRRYLANPRYRANAGGVF